MYPPPAGRPPYGGPQPAFPQGPPPRRGASPALVVLGVSLVVVVLLVAVLIYVLNQDGPSGAPKAAPPSPTAAAGSGFTAPYAGTWTGIVVQIKPSTARYRLTIVIQEGATTGQITATNDPADTTLGSFTCTGTFTFLHLTPEWDFKSVVQENVTSTGGDVVCDPLSYSTLFPGPDNTGGPNDGMFYKNYFSRTSADADTDHNAIGELKRQSGAAA